MDIKDELAWSVWKGKYAIKGETAPADMHARMAKEFARIEYGYNNRMIDYNTLSDYGKIFFLNKSRFTEKQFEEFIYSYFQDFKYIVPQGSIMSMLGNKYKIGSLSNCFVIGQPHDSYGGIFQKDEQLVQLMKRRGGVGLDISTLRPESIAVSNAAGSSTGAVSFMHRYSNSTREVAQNGRRGALMITIDIRHPDVLKFIKIKNDLSQVTGANISVQLRDDFMMAVENNEDYLLRWPCNKELNDLHINISEYAYDELCTLKYDGGTEYVKRIKAREYFNELVKSNWTSAEPGTMFVDRHWEYSPDGVYSEYRGITTNPCGEIFMQMYDACRLLALNFLSIVEDAFKKNSEVNYRRLYEMAYLQQRLADDLVDLEIEHIDRILKKIEEDEEPEEIKRTERELWENIRKVAASGRRTGCGFTALGDMLAALGMKYDGKEAKNTIDNVMITKLRAELDCTIDMSIERGSFVGWDRDKEFNADFCDDGDLDFLTGTNDFYQMLCEEFFPQAERMYKYGRRNVSWSTVAPTGSLSILTQTTSGLEPVFKAYYIRRKKVNPGDKDVRVDFVDQNGDAWQEYPMLHPQFKKWLEFYCEENNMEELNMEKMTKDDIEGYFYISPWYGSEADDIDWLKRVEIQAIIQRYTSHSISSTINLPKDVTEEKISEIYMESWRKGLKGVTVYRDTCRSGVLVSEENKKSIFEAHDAPKRPKVLEGDLFNITARGEHWTVVIGLLEAKPYEIFAIPGKITSDDKRVAITKAGKRKYNLSFGDIIVKDFTSTMSDESEALTRMISTALRHGSSIDFIVQQLNKSHGSVVSFSKAVGRALSKYAKQVEIGEKCAECNSENTIREEGCFKCLDCGSSKCG